MVRIVAVYGSPRRKGNTILLLKKTVQGAKENGAEVEEVVLRDLEISPCLEIYGCKETGRCVIQDDFQRVLDQIQASEGIMLASPIFFYAVSAHTKMLIERCQSLWVKKYWIDKVPYGQWKKRHYKKTYKNGHQGGNGRKYHKSSKRGHGHDD